MASLPDDWQGGHVDAFHAERPGVTERVLSRTHANGIDPYARCAAELLSSLYLPGVATDRLQAGRSVLRARVGHDLGIPLRRLVLERTAADHEVPLK